MTTKANFLNLILRPVGIITLGCICICPVRAVDSIGGKEPPRAARSVHLSWPAPESEGYYMEMAVEKSTPGSYFMAAGWSGGYFGIQEHNDGRKVAIFSVWDPTQGDDQSAVPDEERVELLHEGEGLRIKRFGGEGTGGQCMMDFPWEIEQTNRFLVRATVQGNKTAYAGYLFIPEKKEWKHLVTFRTRTGGKPLKGLYSFVEDFRRDGSSVGVVRQARFGNGWVENLQGEWLPLKQARFTASGASWEARDNINGGIGERGFFLATGGDTTRALELSATVTAKSFASASPTDLPADESSKLAGDAPEFSDVFVAGKDQFKSIRIPSVVVTKKGTVLAIAEGRAQHADQANNKLILKRSADGGKTWGAQQIIADDGENCLNNPCAVVDQNTGRVIMMYQSYPANHSERDGSIKPGLDGPHIVRNYVVTSDDDGATWSKPLDVTRTTKTPERVTIVASGPGIGIQLQNGSHKGRILMPFNEGPFNHWNVLAVYSDDGGKNWKLGQPAPGCRVPNGKGGEISLVNEVQMIELADGAVMLNSRKWGGKDLRKIATSKDGGVTWSKIEEDPALRDPGCMASVLRYTFPVNGDKSRLLYSGPDSTKRDNGTVYLSYDEGKTWPVKKVLFPGSFAYSVLSKLPDGAIGCLLETDEANRIIFARFTLEWLTEGKDSLPSAQ